MKLQSKGGASMCHSTHGAMDREIPSLHRETTREKRPGAETCQIAKRNIGNAILVMHRNASRHAKMHVVWTNKTR